MFKKHLTLRQITMARHSSKSNKEHSRAKGTGSQWREVRWCSPLPGAPQSDWQ